MDEPGGELCTGSLWSLFIPPAMSLPLFPVDGTPPSGQSLLAPSPLDSLAPAQEELPSPSLLSPCHSHTYPHRAPHASWGDGKGDDRVTGGGSIGQTPDKRHLRPTSFQTPAASNSAVVGESDLSGMEAAATPRGQRGPEAWSCQPHRGLEGQGPQGRPAAVVLAKYPKVEGYPSRDRHVTQACAQSQGSVRRALGCDWHLVP